MFVATLTASAERPVLAAVHLGALRARGGRDPVWLSPGVAAEVALPAAPDDLEAMRAELGAEGIDLNLQPAAGRRKRLLLADMDSTMIAQECVDELAAVAGAGPKVREITARAMSGEIGFEGALTERVALLAGLDLATIDRLLAERITFTPGGGALVATMRAHGAYAMLVSGGFTAFSGPVAAALGFDAHRANTLLAEGGRLTGEVARPILGREAKVAALEELCARLGIGPGAAMAVGDGANDLGMIRRAGAGVALHAKPAVAAEAGLRIDHGDLRALLYLQGYSDDQIVAPAGPA